LSETHILDLDVTGIPWLSPGYRPAINWLSLASPANIRLACKAKPLRYD